MYFGEISEWLLDWVFPRFCLNCGLEGTFLCDACVMNKISFKTEQVCPVCRRNSQGGWLCQYCKKGWYLDGLLVAVETNKIVKKMVHAFKYQDLRGVGKILNRWQARAVVGQYQMITSVPMHWKRKWWRGYNQAEILGRLLARKMNVAYRNCLVRKKYTISQVELNKKERMDNVKDVFEVVSKDVLGENILIVDDVCTTMATLDECAKELKKGGAKKVCGLVVARGV